MNFCGETKENKYTITVEANRLTSILVESQNSCHRKFYQRGPVLRGLTVNQKIFEEALLAVCKNEVQMWAMMYNVLSYDSDYGREQIQMIFQRHFI